MGAMNSEYHDPWVTFLFYEKQHIDSKEKPDAQLIQEV